MKRLKRFAWKESPNVTTETIRTSSSFDPSGFERKYIEEVFGLKIKVSSPEDTILAKFRWAKLSGGSGRPVKALEAEHEMLFINPMYQWRSTGMKNTTRDEPVIGR